MMKKIFQSMDNMFKSMDDIFDEVFNKEIEHVQVIEKNGTRIETTLNGNKVTLKIDGIQVYTQTLKI